MRFEKENVETTRPRGGAHVLREFLLAFLLLAITQVAMACQAGIEDSDISEAIKEELIQDPAVLAGNVQIETEDGIVTLRGTTENLLARDWTERIAETVKGVRSVINLIDVEPVGTVSDDDLQRDVRHALLLDPATDSYEVTATVGEGEVSLIGQVDSWAERRLSEMVVKGVQGVSAVENHIDVEPADVRNDIEIQREIEESLRWNVLIDHALIDVRVADGRVILQGIVGSAAEKRKAGQAALIEGVKGVDTSPLVVARWARDEDLRAEKYAEVTDEQIEEALGAALVKDPRLSGTDLSVSATDGVVTLRGEVKSLKGWRTAVDLAHSTLGVISVQNYLVVEAANPPSDAEIAEDIRAALRLNPLVSPEGIKVTVLGGVATLVGSVANPVQRVFADDVAARVRNVVEVKNELVVADEEGPLLYDPFVWDFDPRGVAGNEYKPFSSDLSDQFLEESIEREFYWSPFVDGDDVTVSVEDGVATLTGTVGSPLEETDAIKNAYEGGAIWVESELAVVPVH